MSRPTKNPLYFITLMPPSKIRKEIETIKKEIREKYRIKHALKLPAHITVQIPFRMTESQEKILIKKLEKFSDLHRSWTTELEDFGRFAKNVIFIKIKDHHPFIELHRDLQELMLNFIDLQSHEISSKIHPHVTIATRDLKRSHFPEIWEDFKDRSYSASFDCKELYLLKHDGKTWNPIRKFHLGN